MRKTNAAVKAPMSDCTCGKAKIVRSIGGTGYRCQNCGMRLNQWQIVHGLLLKIEAQQSQIDRLERAVVTASSGLCEQCHWCQEYSNSWINVFNPELKEVVNFCQKCVVIWLQHDELVIPHEWLTEDKRWEYVGSQIIRDHYLKQFIPKDRNGVIEEPWLSLARRIVK